MSISSKPRLNLYTQAALWLAAPVVIQLIIFVCYGNLTQIISAAENEQYQSRTVIGQTNWILALCVMQKFSCFVFTEKHNVQDFNKYNSFKADIENQLGQLLRFTSQSNRGPIVESLIKDWRDFTALSDACIDLARTGDSKAAIERLESSEYQAAWERMTHDRSALFTQDRTDFERAGVGAIPQERHKREQLIELAIFSNVAFALLLLLGFSRHIAKRLAIINDNAHRLSRGEPLNQGQSDDDEIGSLDQAFHNMALSLEEARHREAAIIENVVDVICSINSAGVVTRITQSCLTSWGYEPDSVVGRKLSEFLQPRSVLTTAAAFEEAIKLNRSFSLENELQHANGSIITVHWTGCWSATERSLFCVARDISEQRRLDEAKRQFVAMVSHDLRTPLTSLNVFLQLILAEQVNHETLLKCAQTSKKSVDNLIRLITDLLDFEKLEHGMVPLELRTFKIDIILQSVLDTVRDLALDKGVKISVTASDLEITADQQRLEQVVLNLLSNAIKFSPSGGIVLVAAQKHDDYVKFTVQDQGRGVPKGQQSQIFERFHQVESGDGKRGVGTGLGLAICKALVEQHHGSIGVISEPGQGSTFWFTIPIHRVDQEQSDGGSADEAIRFQPGARQTHTS